MAKKTITMYLHSDKEYNYEIAQEVGLDDEAYSDQFKYALYEVEFTLEVDTENGSYKILKIKERGDQEFVCQQ